MEDDGGRRRTMVKRTTVIAALAVFALAACSAGAQEIALPEPVTHGDTSIESAIERRRSVRSFAAEALTLSQVGQLLWAASGSTVDGTSGPTRAAASAGGLYPVESYVVAENVAELEAGVYRYLWSEHALQRIRTGSVSAQLERGALSQPAVGAAPAVVVLAADYSVTAERYGERGVERYVHMDAGHAAQNVILQAEALALGSVPIGAFDDAAVAQTLDIETEPLYVIPVGEPAD
ncbi:MAG: SagB/ThcOx family dehydrogenase [Spirochaetia bacterium]